MNQNNKTRDPYIRRKGKQFVIEQKIEGKTKYLISLPDASTLLELLKAERLDKNEAKASKPTQQLIQKVPQKFVESTLSEPIKKDAKIDLEREALRIMRIKQEEILKGTRSDLPND